MARAYHGGSIRILRETADYGAYTRSEVRYRSDGVRVTGVLHVPAGRGPFPALVLAHGYIEPSSYVTGQGMSREMDFLARAGYVLLHTDYRGHAGSDPATALDRETRLGYTEDVITAVQAIKRLPYVDPDRVGLLGRSMGGGIVLNVLVTKPGLADAAVVYAPVSSRFLDNFNRWTRPERPDVAAAVLDRLGTPAERPAVYKSLSPRTFFDRITEPVLIHHGTADESCPVRWSRETFRALRAASVDARLQTYPGEPHAFVADWALSIRRTDRFFDHHL
jgi:dipeptidyl aminopeptidase/acylaminoacyl peptidase